MKYYFGRPLIMNNKDNVIEYDYIKQRHKELEDARCYSSCMKWVAGQYNKIIYWGVKSDKNKQTYKSPKIKEKEIDKIS